MALPVETNEALVLAETHDQGYFLDLFDRILPADYLEPLKSPGPGYEVFQALAALGERISQAVARFSVGNFIGSAAGGQKARANVLFSRPTFTAGAVVVQARTIVTTSQGDRRFELLADVSFGATDLGPLTGLVEAIAFGYEYNVRGERTAADGELLPGEIDTIHSLYEDPSYGDPTIVVHQVEDASGGQAEMLDQLGIDRGLLRSPAEADDPYRTRIITLPDTVSPDAIRRALDAMLDPLGIPYELIETFEIGYQTCYDAPAYPIPANPDYDPNLFCYDDPRRGPHFNNVWLDDVEYRGAFVVVVPFVGAVADYGMAYDDTAMTPADLVTPGLIGGRRAVSAYDVPLSLTSIELVGAYDGTDLGAAAIWKGVYDLLQKIKAAGVAAVLEQYSPVVAPTITGIDGSPDPYALIAFDHFPSGNPPNGDTITLNGTGFLTVFQVDFLRTAGTNAQADAIDVAFTIIGDTSIEVTALAIYTAYEAEGGLWPSEPGGPASFPIGPWKPRVWNPGGIAAATDALNVSLTESSSVSGLVAAGNSICATSPDAIAWSPGGSLPIFCFSMASNGSRLVAVGDSIYFSDDQGAIWTERSLPTADSYDCVVWCSALSLFVAVGEGTLCATSPDGDTWTPQTIPAGDYFSVVWSPTLALFVAVGIVTGDPTLGVCATSPDGIVWTPQTIPNGCYYSVVWSPELTLFAAVGTYGVTTAGDTTLYPFCATSPDGIVWTPQTIPNGWYASLVWSSDLDLFVAVGATDIGVGGVFTNYPFCATSPDGIVWTPQTIVDGWYSAIAWSPDLGLFIAVGDDLAVTGLGVCATSANGSAWTPQAITTGTYYAIIALA